MILYQPTPSEITASAAIAKHRNPYLGSRLDKAVLLLTDINANLDCSGDTWHIRSQSDAATWHAVSVAGCTCNDYRQHAPQADRYYFCKHLLAYYGYRRMLGNALNRRFVGNLKYANDRRYAQICPGSVLAATDKRPRAVAYSSDYRFPRHVCFLRLDATDRLVPQTDDDYAALAEWLYTAPDFERTPEPPRMEDYTPERTPEWSHSDFTHWLNTGDTPAMRARS